MLRRFVLSLLLLGVGSSWGAAAPREPSAVLPLWPGKAPGETTELPPEADTTKPDGGLVAGKRVIRLGNVSQPTLSVYLPPKEKQNGSAIVICPGGGYNILALDLEGSEVAEWFNERGVTCFVLKYRVPKRPGQEPKSLVALQDGQRAISLVRSRASEWEIDPARIGILGFSAGGNLAGMTSMHYAERRYDKVDGADDVSARPDFSILIYPAYFYDEKEGKPTPDVKITKETPPAFLAHAADDRVTALSSVVYFTELRKAGVSAELHIYAAGGHGYGLRRTEQPVTGWPARCAEWLEAGGWLNRLSPR
jgi:acetyl esterase/lipase